MKFPPTERLAPPLPHSADNHLSDAHALRYIPFCIHTYPHVSVHGCTCSLRRDALAPLRREWGKCKHCEKPRAYRPVYATRVAASAFWRIRALGVHQSRAMCYAGRLYAGASVSLEQERGYMAGTCGMGPLTSEKTYIFHESARTTRRSEHLHVHNREPGRERENRLRVDGYARNICAMCSQVH